MVWQSVNYGVDRRRFGRRRRVNSVYLCRSKKSSVIDKSQFCIEPQIIASVGWMHHDSIDFQFDSESKRFRLFRNPQQGHKLQQPEKRKGAAVRLVLSKDLFQKTLLEWFPVLRSTGCTIKTIKCEIAKEADMSLVISNLVLIDQ